MSFSGWVGGLAKLETNNPRNRDFDNLADSPYIEGMKKYFVSTAVIVIASATTVPAIACDMHGAGFGAFGNTGANWQPYSPRTYTEDPAFLDQNETDYAAVTPLPPKKVRPSFSNAANRAAIVCLLYTSPSPRD